MHAIIITKLCNLLYSEQELLVSPEAVWHFLAGLGGIQGTLRIHY